MSDPQPRWLRVVMIMLSVGYAAVFAFALFGVLMSPFVFDSGETARTWGAFFVILCFPVTVGLGALFSWWGYRSRRYWMIPVGPVFYILNWVVLFVVFS